MKDFQDKVAVVTGGASGLGRAMARRFAREGMKLVLADVQQDALDARVEPSSARRDTPVIGVCDRRLPGADVERLREKTLATFGEVHVVCNNAGVAPGGLAVGKHGRRLGMVLGVNVYGVIHGVRSFVPVMLRAGRGRSHRQHRLGRGPALAAGHGDLLRVEARRGDADANACTTTSRRSRDKVRRSVLCPAYVPTGDRRLGTQPSGRSAQPQRAKTAEDLRARGDAAQGRAHRAASPPSRWRDRVRSGPRRALLHPAAPKIKRAIETRMEDILLERAPTDTPVRRSSREGPRWEASNRLLRGRPRMGVDPRHPRTPTRPPPQGGGSAT